MVRVLFVVHNQREGDIDPSFPLGTAYLASVLENRGVDVGVIDLDAMGRRTTDEKALVAELVHYEPDFICTGFSSARYNLMKPTLRAIRKACDETKAIMVIGGHAPSATPVFMKKDTGADVVIVGEAEVAIVDVVLNMQRGIVWGLGVKNLDEIPFPAWHLFYMKAYTDPRTRLFTYGHKEKMFFMTTSRGCVGRCSFCYRMIPHLRLRSIDNIKQEMMFLHDNYGVEFFFLYDEMAIGSSSRIKHLIELFNSLPFNVKWASNCRAEVFQRDGVAERLVESGCINMGIGFESMDAEVLKLMNKKTTPEMNIIAAENCRKAGLNNLINVLWALPGDTPESLQKNVDFVLEYSSWNECRTIKPVQPYPGSPLYDMACQTGHIESAKDFYEKLVNLDLITVNFTNMPTEQMYELLYEANCALIDEYVKHADHELVYGSGEEMKKQYYDLYFNKDTTFRGVR